MHDVFQDLLNWFRDGKFEGEELFIFNRKNQIIHSTDENSIGEFRTINKQIVQGKRSRLIIADKSGKLQNYRPISIGDTINYSYMIKADSRRLAVLEKKVMDFISDNQDRFKQGEKALTYTFNLDAIARDTPPHEELNSLNQKNTPGKKRASPRKRFETSSITPPLSIAYLFVGEKEKIQLLKQHISRGGEVIDIEAGILFVIDEATSDFSLLDMSFELSSFKVYSSYHYDPIRKKSAIKALMALYYLPNPVIKDSIISFEQNRISASILLTYLDHPDLFYDDISSLHQLESKQQLYTTFTTFIEANGSVKQTCERLQVHRNTINNRLKKIENILHLPLLEEVYSYKLYTLFILSKSLMSTNLPDVTKTRELAVENF